MGKAGRERAIDAFSWPAIAEKTVRVYGSVL
jgi:starch synthase